MKQITNAFDLSILSQYYSRSRLSFVACYGHGQITRNYGKQDWIIDLICSMARASLAIDVKASHTSRVSSWWKGVYFVGTKNGAYSHPIAN